ncbi:MAG: DUF3341 domain-containing protein [Bdellovibrionia bacterium]
MSLYGLMLEFAEPETLIQAAELARKAGYKHMDAYTPFPVEGLTEALGLKKDKVALITLIGGVIGCVGGFFMQWYAHVIDYPFNVGGRPLNSWPAFIPITFELTVLLASLSAAIGMMALNRLPEPWHPVFSHPDFTRASRDRFFLCIQSNDPLFDPAQITKLMHPLQPITVQEVQNEEVE